MVLSILLVMEENFFERFQYSKRFGGVFSDFVQFLLQNIDLLILLNLEEHFTLKFYSYNRTKHSSACFFSDSCIFENFLDFTVFLTLSWDLDSSIW